MPPSRMAVLQVHVKSFLLLQRPFLTHESMVYRKAPSPRELSAKPTEGVKEYFACADYSFVKFMTDEELVTVIRQ